MGLCDYLEVWEAMKDFTQTRQAHTLDQIWFLEHWPVYTLGKSTKETEIMFKNNIPVVKSDRGGQITYHGPGQLIIYPLLNLTRLKCSIRALVTALENTIIAVLKEYHIITHAKAEAPGVYVGFDKIASLGLRVRHGACYHGIALNINMDLEPFKYINPCGFSHLTVTQLANLTDCPTIDQVKKKFLYYWRQQAFYANVIVNNKP